MQYSNIIPQDRLSRMVAAGLTKEDIDIIEELVQLHMPKSRYIDPLDEAIKDWRKVKIMAAQKKEEERKKNAKLVERSQSIFRHGGIESMADGKIYTCKSAYESSLKAQGMVVVGNDTAAAKPQPKLEEIDWKQAIKETLQQTKISPTKKGKKR